MTPSTSIHRVVFVHGFVVGVGSNLDAGRGSSRRAETHSTIGRFRTSREPWSAAAVLLGLQRNLPPEGLRGHHIATLFGAVTMPLPRFRCTDCYRIETSVGWPSRCRSTPELDKLQAHLSALMTYRVASGVLQHLLPIDAGRSPETLRNHTLRIGEQLGTATADQPTTAAAAAAWIRRSSVVAKRVNGTWGSASEMSKLQVEGGRCSERSRRRSPTSRR